MHELSIKRIYKEIDPHDGYRILIDRLWPRGVSKEEAAIDYWAKSITPSTVIRKAFDHKAENMDVFKRNYVSELNDNPSTSEFLSIIAKRLKEGNVTLLYGAKDEMYNHAIILKEWVLENLK